jgi:uncharacterized protein (TIGR00369 family)
VARADAHHRRLEALYHAAPTNAFMPSKITIGHGVAQLRMEMSAHYGQAIGNVHGMFPCKVLDEVGFYAANSLFDDVWLTTASLSTDYTGPIEVTDVLHARADVVHAGKSSVIIEGRVWTDDGTLVARGNGTFVRTKSPLPDGPAS